MNKKQAEELLYKFKHGTCTDEEKALLDRWYLSEISNQPTPDKPADPLAEEALIWGLINKNLAAQGKVKYIGHWYKVASVAVLFLCASLGAYYLFNKKPVTLQGAKSLVKNDILPGSNKAILTLSNGKQIVLTGAQNGTLAVEGNAEVKKTADGKIIYQKSDAQAASNAVVFNTMTTPRGGQYCVVLPDGSKAFLNASSSITYPTTFTGKERIVQLNGEAYFEVVHNAAKPFKVNSRNQTVEVLGTHFNINSYADEPQITTTLLEGKVKVSAENNNQVHYLMPGQQAALKEQSFKVVNVDTDAAIAWKNGLIMFEEDNIEHIMRQLSRWYTVDIIYHTTIPNDLFSGSISRFKNVSEVLNLLQLTGKVHFKVEGQKIIVSK